MKCELFNRFGFDQNEIEKIKSDYITECFLQGKKIPLDTLIIETLTRELETSKVIKEAHSVVIDFGEVSLDQASLTLYKFYKKLGLLDACDECGFANETST